MQVDFFSRQHKVCSFLAAQLLLFLCLSSLFIYPLLFGGNLDNFPGDSHEPIIVQYN